MDFTEKLRLKGKAEEDLYFAKLDRQLIEALHEKQKQEQAILKSDETEDSIIPSTMETK
ncbi:hypothetical protein [Vibrio sp. STUT-A11]|uniref:hypothetical protein n=1 Tax=unclassified Vibrio TaxID=2614977 RepID=UPI00222F1475|nr:hypothetical protein [Vibrio sp. STUT-A11]BDR16070.1 hypothetical protein VspSTUT11_40460 [Vibrio sp. STUT-A11]